MNARITNSTHWSFWLIAIFALLWNGGGIVNFYAQMNPEIVASLTDAHRTLIEGRPSWATAGFAIAVFAGALGGLCLLIKQKVAFYLFTASLIGTILVMFYSYTATSKVPSFSSKDTVMMIVLPLAVAVFYFWFSRHAISKRWIG